MVHGGATNFRGRRLPAVLGRRRGQGVITGLAARRPAALLKRAGTFNRVAVNQVHTHWSHLKEIINYLISAKCKRRNLEGPRRATIVL